MSKLLTLYQYTVCPFCLRVRAFLDYKKIPYNVVEVHPLNKKEIAFSSYKKVPIIVDADGQQINDSAVIIDYLEEKFPKVPVFEQKKEASEVEAHWLRWSERVLVSAIPPLIYKSLSEAIAAFSYITKVAHFSWWQQRLIQYAGAFVMTIVAKRSARRQGIEDPVLHFNDCLERWAEALAEKPFLGGKKPNAADLSVYGFLCSIENLPSFSQLQAQEPIHAWFLRCRSLVS